MPEIPQPAAGLSKERSSDTRGPSGEEQRQLFQVLAAVSDPEIPVLSITDLGIIRYVRRDADQRWHVGITPTYSGCPATEIIRGSIRQALTEAGYPDVMLDEVLYPPWTSDWLTQEGRRKLEAFGIAPPAGAVSSPRLLTHPTVPIACPRCGSHATERVSEFGSTPCKAHYRCTACLEPFDYFKCI